MITKVLKSDTIKKIDKSTIITVILLSILAMLVILWGLGKNSLYDWDEAIYAQVSKEMVQRGDWLRLHWGDKPWMEKPPLYMWMTSIFYFLLYSKQVQRVSNKTRDKKIFAKPRCKRIYYQCLVLLVW